MQNASSLAFLGFAVMGLVVFTSTRSGYNEGYKKGVQQGYEQFVGRSMKYKDLPAGQYRVIAVVNEYTKTAVVEKRVYAGDHILDEAKQFFLVTDMMPQQMKEGYIWGEVQ